MNNFISVSICINSSVHLFSFFVSVVFIFIFFCACSGIDFGEYSYRIPSITFLTYKLMESTRVLYRLRSLFDIEEWTRSWSDSDICWAVMEIFNDQLSIRSVSVSSFVFFRWLSKKYGDQWAQTMDIRLFGAASECDDTICMNTLRGVSLFVHKCAIKEFG